MNVSEKELFIKSICELLIRYPKVKLELDLEHKDFWLYSKGEPVVDLKKFIKSNIYKGLIKTLTENQMIDILMNTNWDNAPKFRLKNIEADNYTGVGSGMKYDQGKLRFDLIPPELTEGIAEVLTYGAEKYAPNSWQTVPNGTARYLGATHRHLNLWQQGEKLDRESQLHHLKHAITNLWFLIHLEENDEQ